MKIDTANIEGFNEMTPEEKVTALLDFEVPEPEKVDMSGFVSKKVFDAKASEAASLSRKLKSKMSEEEIAKAERDAKLAEMEQKVVQLEREKTESIYKAQYLSMPGYDEALAEETAKAMADGNMKKVFENQKKAYSNHEKMLKSELMKQVPHPDGSNSHDSQEVDKGVELAKKLGKAKNSLMDQSNSILKQYLGG